MRLRLVVLPAIAAAAAVVLPTLVNWYQPPIVSFIPQVLALFGWGIWLACVAQRTGSLRWADQDAGFLALLAALAVLAMAIAGSGLFAGLPAAITVRDAAVMAAAVPALWAGAALLQPGRDGKPGAGLLIRALLLAFVVAGVANAVIAWLQTFASITWLEPLAPGGRAGGHVRQPNLLATQLLWALLAMVALKETTRFPRWLFVLSSVTLISALAMSASRMGALACLLPAAWGLLDRRLSRDSRVLLVLLPVLTALAWWLFYAASPALERPFAGIAQLNKADVTSSRTALWLHSLRLIADNPWWGVGWGQFNFAWTLSPVEPPLVRTSGYPFTHAHNLLLHWAVEFGLPLTLALCGLLAYALWRAWLLARRATGVHAPLRAAALVMVGVVLWHSQFEFPLWHVHYLLPAACLWGLALAPESATLPPPVAPRSNWLQVPPTLSGGLMCLAACFALWQYQPVTEIYFPPEDGRSESERIERGRQSFLFGHLADRFAGTLPVDGKRGLEPFRAVVFEMIDPRLLLAWSRTEAENGQLERARFLAARLREFDHPVAHQWFAPCAAPAASAAQAFQCTPPVSAMTFRDFR